MLKFLFRRVEGRVLNLIGEKGVGNGWRSWTVIYDCARLEFLLYS